MSGAKTEQHLPHLPTNLMDVFVLTKSNIVQDGACQKCVLYGAQTLPLSTYFIIVPQSQTYTVKLNT